MFRYCLHNYFAILNKIASNPFIYRLFACHYFMQLPCTVSRNFYCIFEKVSVVF